MYLLIESSKVMGLSVWGCYESQLKAKAEKLRLENKWIENGWEKAPKYTVKEFNLADIDLNKLMSEE